MTSKYDVYWLSIMEEIHEGIILSMSKGKRVIIDVKNITTYGDRNSWYGTVEVSSKGIKGGEMAHAMSLGKMIIKQDFLNAMNDISIKFKILNSLRLEIDVVAKKPAKNEIKETLSTSPKPMSFDKTLPTQQLSIDIIYSLLGKLPIFDYSYNLKDLPESGIYFFYETGEKCEINDITTDRIVRIGTHISDNRFRERIRYHYRGNKNSSVFRKHVGSAIINRKQIMNVDINEWMKHMTPTNKDLEELITIYFKEHFRFRCISIESKDERLYLEERLISTLSCLKKSQSENWIGHFAERKEIQDSGLWNVQHVKSENKLNKRDLNLLKERANSSAFSNNHLSIAINKDKYIDTKRNKVICFIPCCKSKYASGNIIKPEHNLSVQYLPNTWNDLIEGRRAMLYCIEPDSPKTTAINLYTGKLYSPLSPNIDKIVELICSNQLQLIIISAGYGIIDALEPINTYDEMMKGKVASHWKRAKLANIIADFLIHEKPTHVFGFFTGENYWQTSSSSYRYFFTEGIKIAMRRGLDSKITGCFYRVKGGGFPSFKELNSLGNTFVDLMKSSFDDSYVTDVYENGIYDGNVKIGFEKISRK